MDSERWGRLNKLLHDALDRSPEERDAFLGQACGGDEPLAREARSLLSVEQQAETFLETPAIELAARVGGDMREEHEPRRSPHGRRFSRITAFSKSSAAAAWASSTRPRTRGSSASSP